MLLSGGTTPRGFCFFRQLSYWEPEGRIWADVRVPALVTPGGELAVGGWPTRAQRRVSAPAAGTDRPSSNARPSSGSTSENGRRRSPEADPGSDTSTATRNLPWIVAEAQVGSPGPCHCRTLTGRLRQSTIHLQLRPSAFWPRRSSLLHVRVAPFGPGADGVRRAAANGADALTSFHVAEHTRHVGAPARTIPGRATLSNSFAGCDPQGRPPNWGRPGVARCLSALKDSCIDTLPSGDC
jgi:hypothetical protein